MIQLLSFCLGVPFLGAILCATWGRKSEIVTSRIVSAATVLYLLATAALVIAWIGSGMAPLEWHGGTLYRSEEYEFPIVLFFDGYSAVFLGMTAYTYAIIARFCRYYMHREEGYSRFFATILMFVFGTTFLLVAGTVDLLFAGWEIVGISSYLLIAFYWRRRAPVRNALLTYGVYRICDVGILLGAWLTHLVWDRSQLLSDLSRAIGPEILSVHGQALFFMSLLIFLAAAGKSAQFPFCFWLPRAMEGPTPSSAIFYGALSVHLGVFLLLRTYPIWHAVPTAPWILAIIGVLSAMVGTLSGRVQSNIKAQIGYASVAQVGIMLIELAAGYPGLALAHFVGNAGLRCYQLLVSPSVVVYVLRLHASPRAGGFSDWSVERRLPNRLRSTFYAFAFNEGYLLTLLQRAVVSPVLSLGNLIQRAEGHGARGIAVAIAACLLALSQALSEYNDLWLCVPAVVLMVLGSLSSLSERRNAARAWSAVSFSCVLAGIAILLATDHVGKDVATYLVGIVPPALLGGFFVDRLTADRASAMQLGRFQGRVHDHPWTSFGLFVCFLAMAGFPIGPAFIGEDALLHHAVGTDAWLATAFIVGFVLNGIAMARIFSRLCLGQENAFASTTFWPYAN